MNIRSEISQFCQLRSVGKIKVHGRLPLDGRCFLVRQFQLR